MNSANSHYLTSEDRQDFTSEESHHRVSQSPQNHSNLKGGQMNQKLQAGRNNMAPNESSSYGSKGHNESQSIESYGEDPDNSEHEVGIKLFVGQVPKTMDETDLFPVFSKFGPMENITIIRDRTTGQHRGCAFVTYLKGESADVCQNELHDKIILNGGKKPVQVKPAGKKEDYKVFVGMLPNTVTEDMVEEIFSRFGEVTSVFIIRSTDGIRKDCAFVKYDDIGSISKAIDALNGKVVFEGSDRPLIVKLADSKNQKKTRALATPIFYGSEDGGSEHSFAGHFNAPKMFYDHHYHSPSPVMFHPGGGSIPMQPYMELGSTNYSNSPVYVHQDFLPESPLPPAYGYADTRYQRPPRQPDTEARPREGPAGANLFIYHLPHDLTDADLATAFHPFGNVISAKVFVDKYTGESKGFGFVSYDSIIAAEQAIDHMNGFQIGNKRLKVQHKRVHHREAPQSMPSFPPTRSQQPYLHPPMKMMVPPPQAHTDPHFIPASINISSSGFQNSSHESSNDRQSYAMDSAVRDFDSLTIDDSN